MGLPRPKIYTHIELAEYWQEVYGKCTPARIITYITTGELEAEKKTITRPTGGGISWVTQQPVKRREQILRLWYEITLDEAKRFEAENPPTAIAPEPATNAPSKTTAAPPSSDLVKILVARAAMELKAETGKFPQYRDVLIRLRQMVKIDDQTRAIITNVDLTNGVVIIGRDEPLTIKTVKNWLGSIRKEAINAP